VLERRPSSATRTRWACFTANGLCVSDEVAVDRIVIVKQTGEDVLDCGQLRMA